MDRVWETTAFINAQTSTMTTVTIALLFFFPLLLQVNCFRNEEEINRFEINYIQETNLNETAQLLYFGNLYEGRTEILTNIYNWIFPERVEDFYCRIKHDRVPYPEDCRRFYLCLSYKAYLATCPPMFSFDWTIEKCVFNYLVYCYEPVNESFSCPEQNENYRHDKCDRYWLCSNGKAIQRRCGRRKFFSEKTRECVWRYHANCVERPAVTTIGQQG